jgi:ABC-type sugar transport system substrate-binding protein
MKNKFPKVIESATALAFWSAVAATTGLAPAHAEDKINIIVDGGPLWDPFFGAMKKGGEDAAKDLGDFQWVTSITLENECKGYEEAFKEARGSAKLQMIQFSDAYNPTFVTQAIKGQLQSDQTIDAVYTMGAEQGLAAAGASSNSARSETSPASSSILAKNDAARRPATANQRPQIRATTN